MINTFSIKDSKEFQKVINKGQWYGGDFISTYILKNNSKTNNIGLAIGKKVGKAYKRNKVKRLIRAVYTDLEQNIEYGYDIVFVWKSKAIFDRIDYQGIYKDISKALKKAGLINEEDIH